MSSVLYHATYAPLLESIERHGLGWEGAVANWSDSVPGVVYMAFDREVAVSHAETADDVPEDWEIVVLEIDADLLDPELLEADADVIGDGGTVQYSGPIPFALCRVRETPSPRP